MPLFQPPNQADLATLAHWCWPGRVHVSVDGGESAVRVRFQGGELEPFTPHRTVDHARRTIRVLCRQGHLECLLREIETQLLKKGTYRRHRVYYSDPNWGFHRNVGAFSFILFDFRFLPFSDYPDRWLWIMQKHGIRARGVCGVAKGIPPHAWTVVEQDPDVSADWLSRFLEVLFELNGNQVKVALLHFAFDLDDSLIAQLLELSPQVVVSSRTEAMVYLKKELERRFGIRWTAYRLDFVVSSAEILERPKDITTLPWGPTPREAIHHWILKHGGGSRLADLTATYLTKLTHEQAEILMLLAFLEEDPIGLARMNKVTTGWLQQELEAGFEKAESWMWRCGEAPMLLQALFVASVRCVLAISRTTAPDRGSS